MKNLFQLTKYYYSQISLYPAKSDITQGLGQFQSLAVNLGMNMAENDQDFNSLKWHTWHVDSVNDIEKLIKRKSTGIILLKNNKHLDNLN